MADAKTRIDQVIYEQVRETQEDIRKNRMSTGGGEPIPKGHKRTSERRVLQPRDELGHFDSNASAGYGTKYPHRGKGNVPYLFRKLGLADFIRKGVKKGDVLQIGGKRATAIRSIKGSVLLEYFSHFDEDTQSFYLPNFDESKWNRFKTIVGEKGHTLGLNFVERKGRMSRAEHEGMEEAEESGQKISKIGKTNLSRASESTKKQMRDNIKAIREGNIKISAPSYEDDGVGEEGIVDRQINSLINIGKNWDSAIKNPELMKSDISAFYKKNETLMNTFAGVINAVGVGASGVNGRDLAEWLSSGVITTEQLKSIVDKLTEQRKKGGKKPPEGE